MKKAQIDNLSAVIYARYSSDNQREESIDGQLRECRAFAEKNDITLLEPYIDRALSAKTDNRPNFQNAFLVLMTVWAKLAWEPRPGTRSRIKSTPTCRVIR